MLAFFASPSCHRRPLYDHVKTFGPQSVVVCPWGAPGRTV
jgi:hypothetical protein